MHRGGTSVLVLLARGVELSLATERLVGVLSRRSNPRVGRARISQIAWL